jgi:SnoaL-like domain
MKHLTGNPVVDLGDGVATCRIDYMVIRIDESNRPFLGGCGRYSDQLVRHESGWLFRERQINPVGSFWMAESGQWSPPGQ